MAASLRFVPYEQSRTLPNIVVDGSPNEATVLTLTHWPGIGQPTGLAADLSAEMAFNYIDTEPAHPAVQAVTNNHFDQDGLVSMLALIEPEASHRVRERLIDVAAAGDFATYRYRESARASMAIWAYSQPELSPLGAQLNESYDLACATLYEATLPLLIPMIEDPGRFRDLWDAEDARLTASEQAIAAGRVTIEELSDLDLAIVTVTGTALPGGHRFASDTTELIHPMALHNATRCCRLLIVDGQRYEYRDRYETWVQYQSRSLPKRVDLAPLRDELEGLETGTGAWRASPPSALTPALTSLDESSLSSSVVRAAVIRHLRTAPPAWDPFSPSP